MSELIAAFAVLAAGALLTAGAMLLPPAVFEPVGPAAFPLTTGLCLIGLALFWVWQRMQSTRRPENHEAEPSVAGDSAPPLPLRHDLAWFAIALTFIYLLAMQLEWAGFRAATFIYSFALFVLLSPARIRTLPFALLAALVLGPGVHWLFTGFFFIALPE